MALTDAQRTDYLGIMCDSTEEGHMVYWLEEALEMGLVENVIHKPYTVPINQDVGYPGTFLKVDARKSGPKLTVAEMKKTKVIHQKTYTPDVKMNITDLGMLILGKELALNKGREWIIDVKGSYSGGKNNTSGITFPLKQAMMYMRYGLIVQKVVPVSFFPHTWLPMRCKYTPKTGKECKTFMKRAKPFPVREDVEVRINGLIEQGLINKRTLGATKLLLDAWPGVKGVEYDRKEETTSTRGCGSKRQSSRKKGTGKKSQAASEEEDGCEESTPIQGRLF